MLSAPARLKLSPAKWNGSCPQADVSWISRGAGSYYVYFDVRGAGETARLTSPAMVGTGDPITYGRGGVKAKLSVGLWAHPAVIDYDGDGKLDIVVACSGGSYSGIFLFRNLGTNKSHSSIAPSG